MKKITILTPLIFTLLTLDSYNQNVGINAAGTSADVSAILDVSSTEKGVLLPRVALTGTGDVTTIPSAQTSLLVYNTATAGISPNNVVPGYYYWNGTRWVALSGGTGGNDWGLQGNAGTTVGTNFIGTTDAQDLAINTNGAERVRVTQEGNVGIGTTSPKGQVDMHVFGADNRDSQSIEKPVVKVLALNTAWQTILDVQIENYGSATIEAHVRFSGGNNESEYGTYYRKWVVKKIFNGGLVVTLIDSGNATEAGVLTSIQQVTSGSGATTNFQIQGRKSVTDAGGFKTVSYFKIMGSEIGTVTY